MATKRGTPITPPPSPSAPAAPPASPASPAPSPFATSVVATQGAYGFDPKTDPDFIFNATLNSLLNDPQRGSPFFGTLLQGVKAIWSEEEERAATDGRNIYLNQKWFMEQSFPERRGALLHETLHCALLHIPRGRGRDRTKFNIAGDIVINGIIDDYFKFLDAATLKRWLVLPQNVVRRNDLKHLMAEEIYEILLQEEESLKQQRQQQSQGQQGQPCPQGGCKTGQPGQPGPGGQPTPPGQGSPGQPGQPGQKSQQPTKKSRGFDIPADANEEEFWGSHSADAGHCTTHAHGDGDEISDEQARDLEGYWKEQTQRGVNAEQKANTFGRFGGNSLRQIDYIFTPPTINWLSLLHAYVTKASHDYTGDFRRALIHMGIYDETLDTEELKLYVVIDTSGSIDKGLLSLMVSEILGILSLFQHIKGEGYFADADLYGPVEVADLVEVQPKGGGGTSFVPFFEKIKEQGVEHGVVLYLTDGYGIFPSDPPPIDTIWAVTPGGAREEAFPFGKVVYVMPSQAASEG